MLGLFRHYQASMAWLFAKFNATTFKNEILCVLRQMKNKIFVVIIFTIIFSKRNIGVNKVTGVKEFEEFVCF